MGKKVKLYDDDQPRKYVRKRGPGIGVPPEDEVPATSSWRSGCCLVLLALLVLVGLPALWLKRAEIRRILDQGFQRVPTDSSTPEEEQAPASTQPEVAPPESPEGGGPPPPSLSRIGEPVKDLPGHWAYTDEAGTRHIVDSYLKVPARFRPR